MFEVSVHPDDVEPTPGERIYPQADKKVELPVETTPVPVIENALAVDEYPALQRYSGAVSAAWGVMPVREPDAVELLAVVVEVSAVQVPATDEWNWATKMSLECEPEYDTVRVALPVAVTTPHQISVEAELMSFDHVVTPEWEMPLIAPAPFRDE